MNPFGYSRPLEVGAAMTELGREGDVRFIAGGTNLVDLMKEHVARPSHLVDITRLPLSHIEPTATGGLRIGALVSNAELAHHPEVERRYPLLSRAILAGASPQLRNMATTGGNLLQRTRCHYFYDVATPCNKRAPGTGCPARTGINRMHAILGASEHCVATHPSDMCVALLALDATVHVHAARGDRSIPMREFHRLPGDTPQLDTNLQKDELIVAVELPDSEFAQHASYLKVRDRSSYAFALVSVAAALTLDQGRVRSARIALGGVAHKPWRSLEAEALLVDERADEQAFTLAADALLEGAHPLKHNAFKLELGRRAIVRALQQAAGQVQP